MTVGGLTRVEQWSRVETARVGGSSGGELPAGEPWRVGVGIRGELLTRMGCIRPGEACISRCTVGTRIDRPLQDET